MHHAFTNRKVLFALLLLTISTSIVAQVKIKERIEVNPKRSSPTVTQLSGVQASSATYVAPFDCWGTLAIYSYDNAWPGDARVVVNGNTVIDDVVYGSHYINIGDFSAGTTITVSILHGDGSPWPAEICAITAEMCHSDLTLAFSPELICGQEFEGGMPPNIVAGLHFGRNTSEKILAGNWDGVQLVFGESRSLTVAYQGLCGGTYPLAGGTTFTFAITDGQQYARLLDPVTGGQVLSVAGIPQDNGSATVQLVTVGNMPADPALVTVEAQVIGEGTTTITGQLTVTPGDLSVVPTKNSLTYGETLRLDVQKRNEDGSLGPLPEGTSFSYSIENGLDAGYLYNLDSTWTDDWISSYTPSAMFAAVEEEPQPDVVQVRVRVEATQPGNPCEPPDCYPSSMRPDDIKAIRKAISLSMKNNQRSKPVQPAKPRMNADSSYSFGTRKNTISSARSSPAATILSNGGPLVGYAMFEVKKEAQCIFVSFADSNVSVGDTTLLVFKDANTSQPIPATLPMDIFLGADNGSQGFLLMQTGNPSFSDSGVTQPIWYIAPDSIANDSMKVTIVAVPSNALAASTRTDSRVPATTVSAKIREADKKMSSVSADGGVSSIKSFNGPKGVQVKASPPTRAIMKVLQGGVCLIGGGEVRKKGGSEVELSVNVPKDDQYILGDDPPKMPKPSISAQLLRFKGSVEFNWKFTFRWESDRVTSKGVYWVTPADESESYDGHAIATDDRLVDLSIDLEKYGMRGGQHMTLHVEAKTINAVYVGDFEDSFKIKGKNPSLTVLLTKLGQLKYKVICYQESKFNQFAPDANVELRTDAFYPLQGSDPDDFGLMEINNPSDDAVLWNWTANVDSGTKLLDYDIQRASKLHRSYATYNTKTGKGVLKYPGASPLTADQQLIQGFCFYNSGNWHYWRWRLANPKISTSGQWVANPPPVKPRHTLSYPEECWNLYKDPPNSWN